MNGLMERPATLILADGTTFTGKAGGKIGTATGELCFNTGMTGYQEVFTDPSYYGQILIATNVHIGNYGIREQESQSSTVKIAGLVCKHFNSQFSRPMASSSLQDWFDAQNVVAISDIDTRALVAHIRMRGAMNAIISSEGFSRDELLHRLNSTPPMDGLELSSDVSTKSAYTAGNDEAGKRVAILDLGIKQNIIDNLTGRGLSVKVYPARTSFEEMAEWNPDGYFISNGPGDPAATGYATQTARGMMNSGQPVFGICLGHQILCQALSLPTYKMHIGHRGLNHPVRNLITGLSEITSQNHGFGVSGAEAWAHPDIEVTHVNLNDDTVEGIRHRHLPVFSVQYHPEAAPGPNDANYLFDEFQKLIHRA